MTNPARIVLQSLADLVAPSATRLTGRRIGERVRSVLGGLHHQYLVVPASA